MKTNNRNLTRLAAIFAIVCAALLAGCDRKPNKTVEPTDGQTLANTTTYKFVDRLQNLRTIYLVEIENCEYVLWENGYGYIVQFFI